MAKKKTPQQTAPGVEDKLLPHADHGEESYRGSGKLKRKAAIITGGDSGIGRAVAIAFAREGADVAISYLSEKEEKDARETAKWVEEAGRRCIRMRFDVKDRAACKRFVDKAVRTFGRLDIVVNNAAYQQEQKSIAEITEEQLDGTFRTNIYGYFFIVQAALPHLKKGASIINHAHVDKFGKDTVWGRPAQPSEIAPSFVFLASNDSIYYTGETLAPTGSETTR